MSNHNWISVNDRLPEEGVCVDVWASIAGGYHQGDESRIENCFYNADENDWWHWNSAVTCKIYLTGWNVTHWMPLPEPPDMENK